MFRAADGGLHWALLGTLESHPCTLVHPCASGPASPSLMHNLDGCGHGPGPGRPARAPPKTPGSLPALPLEHPGAGAEGAAISSHANQQHHGQRWQQQVSGGGAPFLSGECDQLPPQLPPSRLLSVARQHRCGS